MIRLLQWALYDLHALKCAQCIFLNVIPVLGQVTPAVTTYSTLIHTTIITNTLDMVWGKTHTSQNIYLIMRFLYQNCCKSVSWHFLPQDK